MKPVRLLSVPLKKEAIMIKIVKPIRDYLERDAQRPLPVIFLSKLASPATSRHAASGPCIRPAAWSSAA